MTDTRELNELISKAKALGAKIEATWNAEEEKEGHKVYDTITVFGLKGCGNFPMRAIYAAERLRALTM